MAAVEHARAIPVLKADPDLGIALAPEQFAQAAELLRCAELRVAAGTWTPELPADPGLFGLLVVEGLLTADVQRERRVHVELVGPGDVLQPWVGFSDFDNVPATVRWHTLGVTRLAVLDGAWVRAAAHWPPILAALAHRLVLRSRRLSLQMAITAEPGIAHRVELMLWHFADRWGRMTGHGVELQLPVTHETLSRLVGARRPSVTTALTQLRESGRVARLGDGRWCLSGPPPRALAELHEEVSLEAPSVGLPD